MYALLSLALLILLVIGLISPKTGLFWYKNKQTRLMALVIYLPALVLVSVLGKVSSDEEDKDPANYSKAAQMKDFLSSTDDTAMNMEADMRQEVLRQFNYPKTVEFEEPVILSRAQIKDTSAGTFFVHGKCSAKNAFGVPADYFYEVHFTALPGHHSIDKITVVPM